MINKEIMKLLREKLKVSPQRIYQITDDRRKQHHYTISKETAAYLLAAEYGIDVSEYLKDDELTRMREVGTGSVATVSHKTKFSGTSEQRQIVVEIGKNLKIVDPLLPKRVVDEAAEMASIYPVVYIFENSVRNLIMNVMRTKHGENWWDLKVGARGKEKARDRMEKEDKNRWHGKRGAHPIFYTDIDDLKSIVTASWPDFDDIFPSLQWVVGKIDEIEMSRNVIAHNNPLESRDITRLKMDLQDWVLQISRWAEKQRDVAMPESERTS